MSSFIIVITSCLLFFIGYKFYAGRIEKLLDINPLRKTPAYARFDGVDYVPAKHWTILFGHHFASIAGAAPIVGPVIAVSIWGWGPALLWVVLGTIFIGGIHDYCSLVISIRHNGNSVADIAEETISKNAKIVFLIFVWLALILVISVFTYLCAESMVVKPEIVLPSLGLIPVAIVVGIALYNLKLNQTAVTIFGLLCLVLLILLGNKFPIVLPGNAILIWSIVLLIYCFVASVTPVQILLQPRDYLSAFLLVFGLLCGYAGIILTHPNLQFPVFCGWKLGEANFLWPLLFVTVACGAVSGFHSLIASGTTSKQIASEHHAKRIGYGGMVTEGLLAVVAILAVASTFASKAELVSIVNGGGGPVSAFGKAYGNVAKIILGPFAEVFAVLLLNTFILTTLDTATRIGRYLTHELFNVKNKILATLVVVALAGWLGLSGERNEIWPVFGAANQLIAALTLIVISSWFMARKKTAMYTILPMIFMLLTTIGALILKIIEYSRSKNFILFAISTVLVMLAIFIFIEAILTIKRKEFGVKK